MSFFPQIMSTVIKHEGTKWVMDNNGYHVKFGLNTKFFPEVHAGTTMDEAMNIYYNKLWKPRAMVEIRDLKKAEIVFDSIVQHGQAPRLVQRAINSLTPGKVVEDGLWGPKTRQAINEAPPSFVPELAVERWYYVNHDPMTRNSNLGPWLTGIKKRYMTWATEAQLDQGSARKLRERQGGVSAHSTSSKTPILIFAGVGMLLYLALQ